MRNNYITILFTFLLSMAVALNSAAQQLPFQGKLLENNQPVNGVKTFGFSIGQDVIIWSETHSNVQVTNGLYAIVLGSEMPLPPNLFEAQVPLNLYITVEGSPLDTVPIYPPLETDPTIPEYLKDGISWDEIDNIPPKIYADTSATNELQTLVLAGKVLSVTQGNSVELPEAEFPPQITFTPPDTLDIPCPSQLNFIPPNQELSEVWQSFKACYDELVTSITVQFSNLYQTDIKLTIYPGEGISGQQFYEQSYSSILFPAALQMQNFVFSLPVEIVKGNIYTFKITGLSFPLSVSSATGNPYIDGTSSLGADKDLKFEISNLVNQPFNMHINGMISGDNWGVVPSGVIVMWSGSIYTIPDGWALCDGTNGTPDLRDRFIVGAGTSYPVAAYGGEAMHTLTIDEIPAHTHTVYAAKWPGNGAGGSGTSCGNYTLTTDPTGGGQPHNNLPPYYALAYIMKL